MVLLQSLSIITTCLGFSAVHAIRYNLDAPFHEQRFLTAHNAHAEEGLTNPAANQYYDMYDLIRDRQVRGLMIDIKKNDDNVLELVHSFDGYGNFVDRMRDEVMSALNEDQDLVLWFDIETVGELSKRDFENALNSIPGFTQLIFDHNHEAWKDHNEWPTLREMIAADQRVVIEIDDKDLSGSYGDYFIYFKPEITMENGFGNVHQDRCDVRHGLGQDLADSPQGWTRLFTFNHFRTVGHTLLEAFREDNNWSGVFKHMKQCMERFGKRPNFVALDWIGSSGDEERVVDVLTWGGAIFYENNDMKGDIVCGIPAYPNEITNIAGGTYGCENDEARSVEFFHVVPGTQVKVCDSYSCSGNDDKAFITARTFIKSHYINSFESSRATESFYQCYDDRNGLDGKVSHFVVQAPGTENAIAPDCIHNIQRLYFYEGDSCTQDVVSKMNVPTSTGGTFGTPSVFTNDEIRSFKMVGPIAAGTRIELTDAPSGSFCNDDYASIVVTKDIPAYQEICVSTLERSAVTNFYTQSYFEKNGLAGKVSRIEVHKFSSASTADVNRCYGESRYLFYEGNSCTQEIVADYGQPSNGGSYRRDLTRDTGDNDEARSLKLVGPLDAGSRVIVADHPGQRATDDMSFIVLKRDLQKGEEVCVPSFERNSDNSIYRQDFSGVNGLDGKVSSLNFYNPYGSYLTTWGPRWGGYFSEENGGYSSDSGPILGIYTSDNWGDNKRLLHATASTCKGSGGRWTGWFSEENSDYMMCGSNEYVGQMQCKNSRCDNIRLKCVEMPSHCMYTSGSSITSVQNEQTWIGTDQFLWKVKCEDRYCGRLRLGVRSVYDGLHTYT